MIMIDSKIAQQAAKARASELAALNHWSKFSSQENWEVWQKTKIESAAAAAALADEVMAHGHHLAEDYSP